MKSFSQFISEAVISRAVEKAKRLGLVSDGHGNWYDRQGQYKGRTYKGDLLLSKGREGKKEEPGAQKQSTTAAPSKETQPTAQARPEPRRSSGEEGSAPEQTGEKRFLTVAFGRFNPPTVGHEKLLDATKKQAGGGAYKIYPSRSEDPKKNPLSADEKISYMRKMYPTHGERIINDEDMRSIFDVLTRAYEDGYTGINIMVGADRKAEFEKLANNYNGELYDFDEINVVSAGERDPDAEGVEGMSASKLRKAAADGDFKTFRSGVPKALDDEDAKKLFNTLRSKMGIKGKVTAESINLWEIAPKLDWKGLRENYVNELIFRVGDIVENLNTGLIGKIIRRGTNHLICVTEDNMMFKSWIRDLRETREIENPSGNLRQLAKKAVNRKDNNIDGFVDKQDPNVGPYGAFIPQAKNLPKNFKEAYQEKRVEGKTRVPGKPNTLAGTGGYFKYASDMTPGFEKGDKMNLQPGGKAYSGYNQTGIKEFINKYKKS
jgi:hypothetical protein